MTLIEKWAKRMEREAGWYSFSDLVRIVKYGNDPLINMIRDDKESLVQLGLEKHTKKNVLQIIETRK